MEINRNKDYQVDDYKYKNFVSLTNEEIESIRIWRNHPSIRKVMYNTTEITQLQHHNFINKLSSFDDRYYWLVLRNEIPIGVLNIIEVNHDEKSGQLGYYLLPDFLESGIGMEFISKSIQFLILQIGLKKIFGRTEVYNRNALALNYHLGFKFRPKTVEINGMRFIEQDLEAKDFIDRYTKITDSKELIYSMKQFNQIYNTYKS